MSYRNDVSGSEYAWRRQRTDQQALVKFARLVHDTNVLGRGGVTWLLFRELGHEAGDAGVEQRGRGMSAGVVYLRPSEHRPPGLEHSEHGGRRQVR